MRRISSTAATRSSSAKPAPPCPPRLHAALDRLAEWLPANAIDQKRADAVALLTRLDADPSLLDVAPSRGPVPHDGGVGPTISTRRVSGRTTFLCENAHNRRDDSC